LGRKGTAYLHVTSDYWQKAFLHLQVRKNAQELCKIINDSWLLQANPAHMTSNIHSHQHLMGHSLVAGSTLKIEFPRLRFFILTTG